MAKVPPYIPPETALTTSMQSFSVADSFQQTFSSGVINFTPVATPTDILAMTTRSEDRVVHLKRISISAVASTAGYLDVLIQRSANGGGGTSAAQITAKHDSLDTSETGSLLAFSANRSSGGNGVSNTRPIIRSSRILVGTAAAPAAPVVFDFATRGGKGLEIRSLVEWIVVNLNGQTLPSGLLINADFEWTESRVQRVIMAGDSTTSNANFLFQYIYNQRAINSSRDVRNYGSNGFRLTDFLNNTNGVTYSLTAALNAIPETYAPVRDKIVISYGINDVRTGATSEAQLTALLESTIAAIVAARPDVDIILWGPNSLTSDDPGSTGFVTTTGIFTGMTLAQAAQSATDIMYNAYQSFANDARIKVLVQKQDVFGRTCKTVAASGLMTDILHPNARGQKLAAQQIHPYLVA